MPVPVPVPVSVAMAVTMIVVMIMIVDMMVPSMARRRMFLTHRGHLTDRPRLRQPTAAQQKIGLWHMRNKSVEYYAHVSFARNFW